MNTFNKLVKSRKKQSTKKVEIDPNNVRKQKCSSCPFRENGIGSEYGKESHLLLQASIAKDALTQNRICHHEGLKGEPETFICRGARNYQIAVFYRLGVLDAPTDEAWDKKLKEIKNVVKLYKGEMDIRHIPLFP